MLLVPRLLDGVVHLLRDEILAGEERHRVHVALHSLLHTQALARVRHVHRPVQGENVRPGGREALQETARTAAVEDEGEVRVRLLHLVDDALEVREAESLEVSGGELAGPAVEDLHHLRAAVRLVLDVLDHGVGDGLEEGVVHLGGVEGHLLDHLVVGGGAALDDVGREGEGRAHETEDGGVVAHLLAKQAEGLAHEADGLLRLEVGEGLDVVHAADGVHDDGTGALDNVEGNVHAGEGSEDVGEEDDAVGLERLPGLQGDLDGEVDGLGALAEGGVLLAQVLVDLHVATRLAHHPDGGALDVLAADGAEHEGVLSAGGLGVRGGVHLDGAQRSGALGGSDARGRPLGGRIAGGTRAHGEGGLGGHAECADDGDHGLEGEWGGEEAPWRRCVGDAPRVVPREGGMVKR